MHNTLMNDQNKTINTYISNDTDFSTGSVLINLLEKDRPPLLGRQPRHPELIGLGIELRNRNRIFSLLNFLIIKIFMI